MNKWTVALLFLAFLSCLMQVLAWNQNQCRTYRDCPNYTTCHHGRCVQSILPSLVLPTQPPSYQRPPCPTNPPSYPPNYPRPPCPTNPPSYPRPPYPSNPPSHPRPQPSPTRPPKTRQPCNTDKDCENYLNIQGENISGITVVQQCYRGNYRGRGFCVEKWLMTHPCYSDAECPLGLTCRIHPQMGQKFCYNDF